MGRYRTSDIMSAGHAKPFLMVGDIDNRVIMGPVASITPRHDAELHLSMMLLSDADEVAQNTNWKRMCPNKHDFIIPAGERKWAVVNMYAERTDIKDEVEATP